MTLFITPEPSGEKMYCQIRPMMACAGTPRKKNSERAKLRPHMALLRVTASGMAKQVTNSVVPKAYSRVKPRADSSDGSLKIAA